MTAPVSKEKAAKILHDKEVRGHPLTTKQRGFFGAIASGQRLRKRRKRNKVVRSYDFYRD